MLVTGGTTGIGRAIMLALVECGARVFTFGRSNAPLQETLTLAKLDAAYGTTADVAKPEDVRRVFAAMDEQLGGIDVLICNAGIGAEAIADMPDADWRYTVETNLVGYMACTRAALDRMLPQAEGHIVMISSIAADNLSAGESVYAATKAGIDAFAIALRKEVSDRNIRVSTIAPGAVGSDMQEGSPDEQRAAIGREEMLFAEEIADAVKYILTRAHRCDVVDLRIEPLRHR